MTANREATNWSGCAQDVVQDVFRKALKKWDQCRESRKPWLQHILLNHLKDLVDKMTAQKANVDLEVALEFEQLLRARSTLGSFHAASMGRRELIGVPGTLVAIGGNSPRTSAGASGFRSNVSIWGGPPMKRRMHALARPAPRATGVDACVRARNSARKASPFGPRAPSYRNSRRELPSHQRCDEPRIEIIRNAPFHRLPSKRSQVPHER